MKSSGWIRTRLGALAVAAAIVTSVGLAPAGAQADTPFTSFVCFDASEISPHYGGAYDDATQWANRLVADIQSWGVANLDQLNAIPGVVANGVTLTAPVDALSFIEVLGGCQGELLVPNAYAQPAYWSDVASMFGAPVPSGTDLRVLSGNDGTWIQASFAGGSRTNGQRRGQVTTACVRVPYPVSFSAEDLAATPAASASTGPCPTALSPATVPAAIGATVTRLDATTFHIAFTPASGVDSYHLNQYGANPTYPNMWVREQSLWGGDFTPGAPAGFDVTLPVGESAPFVITGLHLLPSYGDTIVAESASVLITN